MAIKVRYSQDPYIARLQRKFNQESELMCLALQDNDKADAKLHQQKMEDYRQQLKEARG
ncbi:hypothetical protein M0R72_07710 [Candidatus Pacearchaeota archaeon]|jgi:hypothetical protein|nr:hypothetical protein [Candidatus Pacearchaeota archaeon]